MSTNDQHPASHGGRPDPYETSDLRSYAERVAPEITVDTSGVFRAARRRKARQTTTFTLVTALALGVGGWAVAAQPWASHPEVLPGNPATSTEPSPEPSAGPELPAEAQEYLDAGYWRSVSERTIPQGSEPPKTMRQERWTVHDTFGMEISDVARMERDPNDTIASPGLRLGFGGPTRWEDLYELPVEPEALEACLFAGDKVERERRAEEQAVGDSPEEPSDVESEDELGEFGDVDYVELPEECHGGGTADVVTEGRNSAASVAGVSRMVADLLDAPSTPELRDSAWEVLSGLPGIQVDGAAEDSKGRSGTAITLEVTDSAGLRSRRLTMTFVYDPTSHALLEVVQDYAEDQERYYPDSTTTYLPDESGSYDEMPSDIRAVYDQGIAEQEASWNDDREGQLERKQRLANIEAWGLEDKEMTQEELDAATKADTAGSDVILGTDELRGASLEDLLEDDVASSFHLEIHYEAKEGVPPGMIWKAESPNGVPSDRLWLPQGGTIHLWVTPES